MTLQNMPLLDHVGVRVTDLDCSIRFYCELFGFELVERRMQGGGNIEAASLKVGNSLIFLEYSPKFGPHNLQDSGGVDHFCLTFSQQEFDSILARMKALDVKLVGGLMNRTGATGRSFSQDILDPDNNQIEVKVGQP